MALRGKAGFPAAGYVVDHLIHFTTPEERPDCEWCGQTAIRYAHVLTHPSLEIALMTGCDCATVLTGEAKECQADAELMRLTASQRGRFSKTGWARGKRGGRARGLFGYNIEVIGDASGYRLWINETEGAMRFPTRVGAEMRAFDHVMKKLHPKLKIRP